MEYSIKTGKKHSGLHRDFVPKLIPHNESTCKTAFKRSVIAAGGYAISLNSSIQTGIPDMYICLPGCAPIMMEAKYLKDVRGRFDRQINYTSPQLNTIRAISKVYSLGAMGIIFYRHPAQPLMYVVTTTHQERVTNDSWLSMPSGEYDRTTGRFSLDKLINMCKL